MLTTYEHNNNTTVQPKTLRRYTLAQYLQREARSNDKHEFYNGHLVKMPNATFQHNLINSNTNFSIQNALIHKGLTQYFVIGDGQKVYIETENIALYPDMIIICETPIFYDGKTHLITNPLVIIEILSKATAHYDRTDKFTLYKLLPSFQEYVLIDARKVNIENRFQLEKDIWKFTHYNDLNTSLHLHSLDIHIALSDIYKRVF